MFVNKKKMTLTEKIIYAVVFIVLIIAFVFLGTREYETVDKESKVFYREYNMVSEKNVFKYSNSKEVLNVFDEKKSAIIFMAFPENSWSNIYAKLLQEAASSVGTTEILYYNFYQDRLNNNSNYEKLINLLGDYITILDKNNKEIYAPTVVMIKNGKIIYFDDETAITKRNDTVESYWTEEAQYTKKLEFAANMAKFKETTTSTNSSANSDYDTSFLKEINEADLLAKIKKGEKLFVVSSRITCSHCVKFMPKLKEVFEEQGISGYLLVKNGDVDAQTSLKTLGADVAKSLTTTPAVIVYNQKKFIASHFGNSTKEDFEKFVLDNK